MCKSSFEILELPDTASKSEVKEAWRKLANTHHPDKGGDVEDFHKLRAAYEEALVAAPDDKFCINCGGVGYTFVNHGIQVLKMPCQICKII